MLLPGVVPRCLAWARAPKGCGPKVSQVVQTLHAGSRVQVEAPLPLHKRLRGRWREGSLSRSGTEQVTLRWARQSTPVRALRVVPGAIDDERTDGRCGKAEGSSRVQTS